MSTDQQPNIMPSTSSSSSKPPKPLNIDLPGLTRAQFLSAFPNIIQEDTSRPATDHAILCLTCNKSIFAKSGTLIASHFKSHSHAKLQKALDKGITSEQSDAVPKKLPEVLPQKLPDHKPASASMTVPFFAVVTQQQMYNNMPIFTTKAPSVSLDEPGWTRKELLTTFCNVIQPDSSHPQAEQAIRCLTCQKTILAPHATTLKKHLKCVDHVRKQKAKDSGLTPLQYDILSKSPPGTFRILDEDTVQCTSCKINLIATDKLVKHLESDQHIRTQATRAQHEVVEQMTKTQFEKFFTQTFLIDCGIPFNMIEKGRKAIEAMLGRSLPRATVFRQMTEEMKAAKEAEKEGKGEWKRITIPDDPKQAISDFNMVEPSLKGKKRKGKDQEKDKRHKVEKEKDNEEDETEETDS